MTDLHALSAEELRERVTVVGGGRTVLDAFEELYRRAAALEAAEKERDEAVKRYERQEQGWQDAMAISDNILAAAALQEEKP